MDGLGVFALPSHRSQRLTTSLSYPKLVWSLQGFLLIAAFLCFLSHPQPRQVRKSSGFHLMAVRKRSENRKRSGWFEGFVALIS